MDLAARPHITAGVALASAAILAAGPMAQHLPNLHLAQHLPQVSVSNINLTGADSVLDLFSGVENELASLASGAAAATVPASLASAAFDPTQNLIAQTWINTFQTAGANLQTIFNTWSQLPVPALQQVAANGISYGNLYVSTYQTAANAAVKYFTSATGNNFQPLLQMAVNDFSTGKISTGVTLLWEALYYLPLENIALPMEKILNIPAYITQNFANATSQLTSTFVNGAGLYGLINTSAAAAGALGTSLQAVYNAWNAGDTLGAVTNLLNTPGAVTNLFLNGSKPSGGGLFSSPYIAKNATGLLNWLLNTFSPGFAKDIVAPNAANIATGGSLAGAFQGFANQLINGWPSLSPVIGDISAGLTQLLQNLPSVLSNLPSILGNVASQVGTVIIRLLGLL
ncbi:hypothetical protein H7H82_20720 [Mycobacterium heidelbergense]|uniref:hypothetical protein n=1 Tax=Mycobacterium heidelbergense TaxID=53376 RepID=UPI00114FC89E|nr:hypothetical protein [Mycobacterium heidelbergense]MCV7052982.1 hypothetical protein [Mycobacterium heidelbergense]BBZ50857.1 hypothetical protein MHEI_25740 [Mycobacterium heidelbergense]